MPHRRNSAEAETNRFMRGLKKRNPGEPEFHQAVYEFIKTLMPYVLENRQYYEANILERMTEPDRVIMFRVCWTDDQGNIRTNRAWRVQFNNAIGPYKGGLRFHPSVTLGTLKFLGFEQTFKNSLTGLPLGGAKGGANFNPKGKSDLEVMRFCQSMMVELSRHIGEDTDVPAGDIGVGAREVGYLFGQYKRMKNRITGALTGKGLSFGGSLIRKEATGYGAVYFMDYMLKAHDMDITGKTAVVSGSGNVALYCLEKLIHMGAKPVTASDSSGFIHDPDGIDAEKLAHLKELKEVRRARIHEYVEKYPSATFHADQKPWVVPCDLAFPCATQNELLEDDAKLLIKNGLTAVSEGANMPSTMEAIDLFLHEGVIFGPAKAANAGGVTVSGLEQSQNAQRISWTSEKVDRKLHEVMESIHNQCAQYGGQVVLAENGNHPASKRNNYVRGANIAGFVKVADAMLSLGAI